MSRDFWVSSGHHLLDRDAAGRLLVTDAWLKAYLARPELVPPEDACDAERRLHASLLAAPRRAVASPDLAALADADARENWTVMLAFRDHLLAHPTVEAAYLALFDGRPVRLPRLFIDQLVHVIARNLLDGCADPFVLRAAELLFRPQRLSLHEGSLLLADEEVVERHERAAPPSPLARMLAGPDEARLDVLTAASAPLYWTRSDAFDMALPFALDGPGRTALGTVLERWILHLLGRRCRIAPIAALADEPFTWFIGLDAEATALGNALWRGETVADSDLARVVALFRLDPDPPPAAPAPVWLILACSEDRRLVVKPQNLVTGLPPAAAGVAA